MKDWIKKNMFDTGFGFTVLGVALLPVWIVLGFILAVVLGDGFGVSYFRGHAVEPAIKGAVISIFAGISLSMLYGTFQALRFFVSSRFRERTTAQNTFAIIAIQSFVFWLVLSYLMLFD